MPKINPYNVLKLEKDFTLDQLKINYKQLAFANHPDKGGDPEIFNMINACFKKLTKVHKAREEGKRQFYDLKNEFNAHINQETIMAHNELNAPYNPLINNYEDLSQTKDSNLIKLQNEIKSSKVHNSNDKMKGLTMDQFNSLYETTRINESYDKGYGSLMMKSSKVREDIDIEMKGNYQNGNNFNSNAFHNDFDKQGMNKINKSIVKYKDKQDIFNLSSLGCYDIANKNIDDFSGQNDSNKKLQYTDYLKAHSTNKLIDHSLIKERKEYNSIDECEADRANINYKMSYKDKLKLEKEKKKEAKEELKRLKLIKSREKLSTKQYNQLNYMLSE
jgi:curved DNA-binding protein CbpA